MAELEGRRALVTGAARGLGRAIAGLFNVSDIDAILSGFIENDMVEAHKREFEELLNLPDFDAVIARKQGRYGTPEEVARLAVFLASDRSRFSTGSAFVTDGGARASLL